MVDQSILKSAVLPASLMPLFNTLQEDTKLLFVIVYCLLLLLQIGVCTKQVKYITNFILLTIKNTIV